LQKEREESSQQRNVELEKGDIPISSNGSLVAETEECVNTPGSEPASRFNPLGAMHGHDTRSGDDDNAFKIGRKME
jgi:hypothetical protein